MEQTSKTSQRLNFKMLVLITSIFFVFSVEIGVGQSQSRADADLSEAINLLKKDRSKEAIEILKRVLLRQKDNADAWYYLGVSYLHQKDNKKAIVAFETAVKLQPEFANAYSGLAYALLRRGRIGDSSVAAGRAISLDRNNADAHYTLGIISFRLGDRSDAVKHADTAIQARPDFAEAYLLKSQALVQFLGPAVFSTTSSPDPERFRNATDALEKYLKLAQENEELKIWKDQLVSLRFWSDPGSKDEVLTGKQVTTKLRLISKPAPQYPVEGRDAGVKGTVILRAVFASDGTVKYILIIQSLPDGLTEASVRAASQIKFVPATKDGKPVSMWMQLEYNFNTF